MKRIILLFLAGLILLGMIGGWIGISRVHDSWFGDRPNYLSFTSTYHPIPFDWTSEVSENYVEPHASMRVPVSIEGIPADLYMQFDTGSPFSFLNQEAVTSLESFGLQMRKQGQDDRLFLQDFDFSVGDNSIHASLIRVFHSGTPFDPSDTSQAFRIGTIGTDLMDEKITVIDFPQQMIHLYDKRPVELSSQTFFPFDFQGRRLMLPAKIQEKQMDLFFDTGCSAFGLLTSKNRYDSYTDPKAPEIQYQANSFGNEIPVHHKASHIFMNMGGSALSLQRISYVEWHAKYQAFFSQFTSIGGWLGNKPFIQSRLIIDTQKEEFLILPAS